MVALKQKTQLKPKVEVLAHMGTFERYRYKRWIKFVNRSPLTNTIRIGISPILAIIYTAVVLGIVFRRIIHSLIIACILSAIVILVSYAYVKRKNQRCLDEIEEIESVKKYKMNSAKPSFDEGEWKPSKRKSRSEINIKVDK